MTEISLLMPAAVSSWTYVRTLKTAKAGNSNEYYILILILALILILILIIALSKF